jgi:type IV secretory pathway VirD2 relaxase
MAVLVHSTGFYKYPKPWENRKPIVAIKKHIKYIESDRLNKKGEKVHREPPTLFTKDEDNPDRKEFAARISTQKAHGVVAHKFIISLSEDEQKRLGIDMVELVRETMSQYELARKQQLDWLAAYHDDEGHQHCHVVLRGRDMSGKSVFFGEPQMRQMERLGERVKKRMAERNKERGWLPEKEVDWRKQLEQEREMLDRADQHDRVKSIEWER